MKTLIAVPCMDMVHTQFAASLLAMRRPGDAEMAFFTSSLIYDSRNHLAGKAVNEGFDRILWLDSDMRFGPDLMERLSADLDEGREMASGVYFARKAPFEPVFYNYVGPDRIGRPSSTPYRDYPRDTIFEVEGVGFGAVMMKTDLIRRVYEANGKRPFSPEQGYGEDLTFCRGVRKLGVSIWVDSRVKLDHIGFMPINEETYIKTRSEQHGG